MKYLHILLAAACIASCARVEKRYVVKVSQTKLSLKDIYDRNKVSNMVFDMQESSADSLKNEARKYFLKGVDLYKNQGNAAGAIPEFKKSILIYPDAKTYYELGNAIADNGKAEADFSEARDAYDVAEGLKFQPLAMLYFKKAAASVHYDHNEEHLATIGNLRDAFLNGFSDTALLLRTKGLAQLVQTQEYRRMLLEIAAFNSKGDASSLFNIFTRSFPVIDKPFTIPADMVDMTGYRSSISYDFAKFIPEMENVSFGRDVSHDFFYVGKLAETPQYTVLVYTSISFMDEEMQPVHTRIATYDRSGKIIASKLFAGQFSAEKIRLGKYMDGEISIEDYKRIWEKPIDKVGFEENKVKEQQLVASAVFNIQADGKMIAKETSKNYSDLVAGLQK